MCRAPLVSLNRDTPCYSRRDRACITPTVPRVRLLTASSDDRNKVLAGFPQAGQGGDVFQARYRPTKRLRASYSKLSFTTIVDASELPRRRLRRKGTPQYTLN